MTEKVHQHHLKIPLTLSQLGPAKITKIWWLQTVAFDFLRNDHVKPHFNTQYPPCIPPPLILMYAICAIFKYIKKAVHVVTPIYNSYFSGNDNNCWCHHYLDPYPHHHQHHQPSCHQNSAFSKALPIQKCWRNLWTAPVCLCGMRPSSNPLYRH